MMEYPTDLRALAVSLQQLSYLLGIDVLLTDCFFTLFSDYNIDRSLRTVSPANCNSCYTQFQTHMGWRGWSPHSTAGRSTS